MWLSGSVKKNFPLPGPGILFLLILGEMFAQPISKAEDDWLEARKVFVWLPDALFALDLAAV